jgi:hypothetical protein
MMFSVCLGQAIANLSDDVSYSLYFRDSAYTETDPKFREFKEDLKKRERKEILLEREEALKKYWLNKTFKENESFKDARSQMQTIERGKTTMHDVKEMFGKPIYARDPSRPWLIVEYRIRDYLYHQNYPEPREDIQKVVANRFYYTEYYIPRMGMRLDVLNTVNKHTKQVDFDRSYFDTGYPQKYWLVN